ncbi:MAG: ABC transporter ATP-binding protein [Firmicutes bacterium]|nr:ABC transporter ATP-binding protein [Bacillota bacterium]
MGENLLEIRNLVVRFSGVTAVDRVSMSLERGRVYGLIGTNGAGKSTVVNVVSGDLKPAEGMILFKDRDVTGKKSHELARMGIARTFQNLRLFQSDTVLGNVITARQAAHPYNLLQTILGTPAFRRKEALIREESEEYLKQMKLESLADLPASALAYGQQRRLEIARCLALEPDLLLLDEPAAGMNPQESGQLVEEIQSIRRKRPRMTILLIEHDMKVVRSFCEYVYVMSQGKVIEEGGPDIITTSKRVISAYMGGGSFADDQSSACELR